MNPVQSPAVSNDLLAAMNPSNGAAAAPAGTDAQDRFLKLLVTQMKNQDPLNPLDNSQVTSQLAQISTVSGIDKLNTTLQGLVAGSQVNEQLQAAGMVGHGVLVPGSSLSLDQGGAVGGIDLSQDADHVVVTISDASGSVVHKVDLGAQGAGSLAWQWDGMTDSGAAAAGGTYSFSVQATQGDAKVGAAPLAFGVVASVAQDKQGTGLTVGGLGRVDLSQVKQIF